MLYVICESFRSGVVNVVAIGQCLCLFTNRVFGVLHGLPPKEAEVFEYKRILHVMEDTRFKFIENY